MPNNKEILEKALRNNQHDFDEAIQEKFLSYLDLLQQWNRVYNLTAIHDFKEMIYLHLLDSLAIHSYLHGERIIDVGTGAGLPGIPLALIHPQKKFFLLYSNSKKTRFLTQAIIELKIKNIEVVHERAEKYLPPEKFDSVVSRAFASLQAMLANTKNLIAPHGRFLAMKGVYPENEIREIPSEFKVVEVHKLIIKGLDAERHLVCLEKI
jgi:16S rRNA (guanine527-N7)-methyltransferase